MKVRLTKQELKYLDYVSPYTDLIPKDEEIIHNNMVLELSRREFKELNNLIAAEANHTESRTAEKVLDGLFFKIEKILKDEN